MTRGTKEMDQAPSERRRPSPTELNKKRTNNKFSFHLPVLNSNEAGYTATEIKCGWAGAIFEVTRLFGHEQ